MNAKTKSSLTFLESETVCLDKLALPCLCVRAGCEPLQGKELPDHESAGESAQCASLQGMREREKDTV